MLDITTLAAWSDFIAGIAVVVSLLYLAGQIRQNSRQMQIATTVSLGESDLEFSKLMIDDPELGPIFRNGMADRDSLSEIERERFDALINMMMSRVPAQLLRCPGWRVQACALAGGEKGERLGHSTARIATVVGGGSTVLWRRVLRVRRRPDPRGRSRRLSADLIQKPTAPSSSAMAPMASQFMFRQPTGTPEPSRFDFSASHSSASVVRQQQLVAGSVRSCPNRLRLPSPRSRQPPSGRKRSS